MENNWGYVLSCIHLLGRLHLQKWKEQTIACGRVREYAYMHTQAMFESNRETPSVK